MPFICHILVISISISLYFIFYFFFFCNSFAKIFLSDSMIKPISWYYYHYYFSEYVGELSTGHKLRYVESGNGSFEDAYIYEKRIKEWERRENWLGEKVEERQQERIPNDVISVESGFTQKTFACTLLVRHFRGY